MKIQCVHICTGGNIDVLPTRGDSDFLIGVDGGAIRLLEAGIVPDAAIGDFDTIKETGIERLKQAGVPFKRYQPEKDATDTEIAVEYALSMQPEKIVMYGALGGRMDHTLANLQLLIQAHQAGVWVVIRSKQNEIVLLSDAFSVCQVNRGDFPFVSLLPLSMQVTGITLKNFTYPLVNHTIEMGSTLGISNQLLAETGEISIRSGYLYVIKSKDLT